jgi:hypothetical protein
MLKIVPTDFVSLDSFPLRWRWTDSQHNSLPVDRLAQIRPLGATKAAEVDAIGRRIADPIPLNATAFDSSSDQNAREWLGCTLPADDTNVLVSWSRDLAVHTPVELFIEYWDDFCYPSSDDVLVVALSGAWILRYTHWETMHFWKLS